MKRTLATLFAVFTALPAVSQAASIEQSATFMTTANFTGTGNAQVVDASYLTATVNPFNPALGTLESFTIQWELTGTLSGTVAVGQAGGSAQGGTGGTYLINGLAFNGNGGANGTGGGPGEAFNATFGPPQFSQELLASNAGVTYDPGILVAVTGDQPFPVSFSSPVTTQYDNVANLDVTISGKMTLIYNYTPAPLAFTDITRNAATRAVTLSWKSQPGLTYSVDFSEDLSKWETLAQTVESTGASTSFTDAEPPAQGVRRFYRVREKAVEGLNLR